MTTLTGFLLARIAEDESDSAVDPDEMTADDWADRGDLNEARLVWQKRRALAECEAKRRIVGWLLDALAAKAETEADPDPATRWVGDQHINALALAAQSLASVYANHPDYDEAWRV